LVLERKVMLRQNPSIEYRNSKQIRIFNDKMTETNTLNVRIVGVASVETNVFVI
jgi:hypothetical protein